MSLATEFLNFRWFNDSHTIPPTFPLPSKMKRPAAVLFALLRSTQALASSGEKARLAIPVTQNICLRFATKVDIPAISNCNVECLPENYNAQFYNAHLRQWPSLAIVAEDISHLEEQQQQQQRNGMVVDPYHPSRDRSSSSSLFNFNPQTREPKIVAYVLGKIESRPTLDYDNPTSTTSKPRVETLGHVTSLAVKHEYRRLGLAKSLMTQLHTHLEYQGIQSVGLHVRTSNSAACRLYEQDGYCIERLIPSYYQDGEDAYFMRKMLKEVVGSNPSSLIQGQGPPAAFPRQEASATGMLGGGQRGWKGLSGGSGGTTTTTTTRPTESAAPLKLPRRHLVVPAPPQPPPPSSPHYSRHPHRPQDEELNQRSSTNGVSSGASSISFGT